MSYLLLPCSHIYLTQAHGGICPCHPAYIHEKLSSIYLHQEGAKHILTGICSTMFANSG